MLGIYHNRTVKAPRQGSPRAAISPRGSTTAHHQRPDLTYSSRGARSHCRSSKVAETFLLLPYWT